MEITKITDFLKSEKNLKIFEQKFFGFFWFLSLKTNEKKVFMRKNNHFEIPRLVVSYWLAKTLFCLGQSMQKNLGNSALNLRWTKGCG